MKLEFLQSDTNFSTSLSSYSKYTWNDSDEMLLTSIKRLGIISPIIIWENTKNNSSTSSLELLDGRKRLKCALSLGIPKLPALIFSPDELTKTRAFLASIIANATTRELNPFELANIVYEANVGVELEKDELEFLYRIIKVADYQIDKFIEMHRLPEDLKMHLLVAKTAYHEISLLLELKDINLIRLLVNYLYTNGKPSLGELREIVYDLKSLIFNGCDVHNLFSSPEFEALIAREGKTRNKITMLRKYLKEKAFPILASKTRKLDDIIKKCKFETNISVITPEHLEGDFINIRAKIRTSEQLKNFISSLTKNTDNLNHILKLLQS